MMYAVEREEASDTVGVGNHGKRLRRLEMPAESCLFRELYARLLTARERLGRGRGRGRERAGPRDPDCRLCLPHPSARTVHTGL